jgi:chloramphenicol-sensitive protein RarD
MRGAMAATSKTGGRPGAGLASAVLAYGMWGLLPLYFRAMPRVGAVEILAHRVAGSALLLALVLAVARGREGFRRLRAMSPGVLAATTLLIAVNWLLYIWAVQAGRVLEASLGYFVNPLVNVALGVGFLGETLRPRQRAAFLVAGAGVVVLVVSTGALPWIALVLASTFGLYGLLRKRADVEPVGGLFAETARLAPPALVVLGWLAARGEGALGRTPRETVLLALAGAVTSIPLLAFGAALRRLKLSTLGVVQYLAPTGQFLLAVLVFGEPFGRAQAFAFGCIWTALALYTWDALASARPPAPEPFPE